MRPNRPPRPPPVISPLEAYQTEEREKLAAFKLQTVDFRKISRRPESCLTTVTVHLDWDTKVKWLVFGEAQIQRFERKGNHQLKAYLPAGVTDFEHDSAYALRLPLIGLKLDDLVVSYQYTHMFAYVDPSEPEDFRVPRAGYNPLEMEGASTCTYGNCAKKPHIIVPEGHYAGPPFDRELFEMVRGRRVDIITGPAPTEKEIEEDGEDE